MEDITLDISKYWRFKKSHSVGLFTDMNLFYEALDIGSKRGFINLSILERNLPERVIGLKYIETFQKSTFVDLIRELNRFKYIFKKENDYWLTDIAYKLIEARKESQEKYLNVLLEKMNSEYGIPGWLIHRLWVINPIGQGQVVVPSPIKTWKPNKRKWDDNKWDTELSKVSIETVNQINRKIPGAFPMTLSLWEEQVREEYERLGKLTQRRVANKGKANMERKMEYFAPRARLTFAMKNVAVKFLFGNKFVSNERKDFISNKLSKDPINSRTFMVWCPRLETFGLLYYTDYFEEIPGRLLFPCSFYSTNKPNRNFYPIEFIQSPEQKMLYKHSPTWSDFKNVFLSTLYECYQARYNKEGIIYVSIQQVRDEVCRLLRINTHTFENFISFAFRESIKREIEFSIALETDIREDQKSGFQILRRPVFINNVPNSLIAIKKYSI